MEIVHTLILRRGYDGCRLDNSRLTVHPRSLRWLTKHDCNRSCPVCGKLLSLHYKSYTDAEGDRKRAGVQTSHVLIGQLSTNGNAAS